MKPLVSRVCAAACLAAVALVPGTLHAQAKRAITHIAGDLYRFQNNFHFSVFLVTPEGVSRHRPHQRGGGHLARIRDRQAIRPAHQVPRPQPRPRRPQLRRRGLRRHRDGDRPRPGQGHDHRRTPPDRGARHHLLGPHDAGARRQAGRAHPRGPQSLGQLDRDALPRGAHAVRGRFHIDQAPALPHPRRIRTTRNWVDSLRRVEQLDFDILAPGHGAMGTKQDVADHRRYHENLYNAVVAAVRAGKSLEEMKASITPRRVQGLGLVRQLARDEHRRGLRSRRAATPGKLSAEIDAPSDPASPMMPAHELCGAFAPASGIVWTSAPLCSGQLRARAGDCQASPISGGG